MISAPLHSCIQLNQNSLCFDKIRQYFVYPEIPLILANPENVPITVIPLYQSIYSTRKAVISPDPTSIPNFCSFFVDFENRSEFVNLLVLDRPIPVSTFYILGPHNEFVSYFMAGMRQFQKFDRFSWDSYSMVKIVTNSGVICDDPSLVSLSTVNNWRSNPWSYWFSPSDSIRIPLPLAEIYNYHVVTRNVHNRIIRSGYEVLRTQGVIVNKTKELVSETLRVRGVAHQRDSVLLLLNCTPERVELDVSIRIESNLYDVMMRAESMPFQFARFVLVDESENIFDMECSMESSQCSWKVPVSSPSLELMNPDNAIGELNFEHSFSFWVDSESQNLLLSSLESNSFKETVSGEIVFREYHLVCEENEGVLDLNLKGDDILSVMLNSRILFSSSRYHLKKELRISIPIFCSQTMSLVICYHQGELHVAARIVDRLLCCHAFIPRRLFPFLFLSKSYKHHPIQSAHRCEFHHSFILIFNFILIIIFFIFFFFHSSIRFRHSNSTRPLEAALYAPHTLPNALPRFHHHPIFQLHPFHPFLHFHDCGSAGSPQSSRLARPIGFDARAFLPCPAGMLRLLFNRRNRGNWRYGEAGGRDSFVLWLVF